MFKKYLHKKIELEPIEHEIGFKSPIELEYYLIECDVKDCDESRDEKAYGVEIVKKIGKQDVEAWSASGLYTCRESTETVLDKLVRNSVTPVALPYVLDDILGA